MVFFNLDIIFHGLFYLDNSTKTMFYQYEELDILGLKIKL